VTPPRAEPFVLASASPRRRELLASAGLAFSVDPSQTDETSRPGESAPAYARRVAADKAREVARRLAQRGDRRPVLGADTVVGVHGDIRGNPGDRADARSMLSRLSGRTHQVITAYCIAVSDGAERSEAVTTEVRFKRLRPEELEAYLDTGEWHDKAGAYAGQGCAAGLVEAVFGSYTNVVGLPLAEVVEALRRLLDPPGRG